METIRVTNTPTGTTEVSYLRHELPDRAMRIAQSSSDEKGEGGIEQ